MFYTTFFHIKGGEEEQRESQGDERESTRERNEETEGVQRKDHQAKAAGTEEICSDLGDKDTGPKQLKLSHYTQTPFGTQKRAFQEQWFKSFRWLEYSARQNAAFCFPCRVFGKNVRKDALVNDGVNNWQKALRKFQKHETTH